MKFIVTLGIAVIYLTLSACEHAKSNDKKDKAADPVQYKLGAVEKGGLEQTMKLPAQLSAYEEVSIYPKVNGYVKSVLVDIGTHVAAGQLLMTLEAPELVQATMQSKERYARTQADYKLAKENFERLKQAAATAGAVSPLDLAAAHSRMEADSALSNAERASWQMQETMQAYLHVTAPFEGVITERNVHPGTLVNAAAKDARPMLELKQLKHLRLQIDVPESVAPSLSDKDTISFFLSAFPGKKLNGHISRRSRNMNLQYRTEKMEIDIPNPKEEFTPGMYADIQLVSHGNPTAWVVPRTAVITSTERKYVIAVQDGLTKKIDVTTGNQSADKVEVTGNLQQGMQVIVNGSDEIGEGKKI